MDKAQKGFTLIELVVVITILGILAAFAFPRFASLEIEARSATVDALEGSLRAASALAHSLDLVGALIVMEGNTIVMATGYPAGTALGIELTLSDFTGFAVTHDGAGTSTFERDGGTATNCTITYVESTGAGIPPAISADTSAC